MFVTWSGHCQSIRRRRGFTLLEVAVAILLIAIVSASVIATWSLSVRAPADKAVTETGIYIAVSELERLKAQKYDALPDSANDGNGNPIPMVTWYDRSGAWLGPNATSAAYKVKTTITVVVDRDNTPDTEDLRQIQIEVWNSSETIRYESLQTLLTFGGI